MWTGAPQMWNAQVGLKLRDEKHHHAYPGKAEKNLPPSGASLLLNAGKQHPLEDRLAHRASFTVAGISCGG